MLEQFVVITTDDWVGDHWWGGFGRNGHKWSRISCLSTARRRLEQVNTWKQAAAGCCSGSINMWTTQNRFCQKQERSFKCLASWLQLTHNQCFTATECNRLQRPKYFTLLFCPFSSGFISTLLQCRGKYSSTTRLSCLICKQQVSSLLKQR